MFIVYGKENCKFCAAAKELLEVTEREFEYVDVQKNTEEKERMIERVTRYTGSPPKTVPQIFYKGTYIGGFNELKAGLQE